MRSQAGRSPSVSSTTGTSRDHVLAGRRWDVGAVGAGDAGGRANSSAAHQYARRGQRGATGVLGSAAARSITPGQQITVKMSFRRNGELFGQPRITFESAGASDDERLAYRIAVANMLKRCAPLPFTETLGNALAGRPFTIRFVDQRKLRQAENAP
jgi:hypothetical protein